MQLLWANRASLFTMLAGFTLALLTPFGSNGADWPQFLGPTRNGVAPALAGAWPDDGPPVVWQRKVGQGFAGPAVSGGRLILFHRVTDREVVECLDAATEKGLWKSGYPTGYHDEFGFDEGPRATPSMAAGRVFTFGAEGQLHCWNLDSGDQVWAVDTRTQFHPAKGFFGAASAPLVEGNAVIQIVGGRDGAGIVAFEAATGRVLWKATSDPASYSSPVVATFAGKRRVIALTREALVALDPADGRQVFRFPWRPKIQASVSAATPVIAGDLIFISACYGADPLLLRFRESGPERVWSGEDALACHYATSVVHGGHLYGWHGRQEEGCELRCVDLKTGKVRWSETGLTAGTVTLAGDELLVLTEKGQLLRTPADPDGFNPSARAQVLPFGVRAYLALAEGRLYARSKDQLFCVKVSTEPPSAKPRTQP